MALLGHWQRLQTVAKPPRSLVILTVMDDHWFAILFSSAFGFICYIVATGSNTRTLTFNWMIAISGLAAIFTWASICLCHIRFRAAWKLQGHTLDELAFRSQAGVVGSWVGFIFNILILVAQFWTGK
jgi:amino acid transporter